MIQVMDYSKYSGSEVFVLWCSVFYTRYTPLIVRIWHQIYITVNSKLGCSQSSAHASNCVSESSLQDVHMSSPVAINLPAFGLHYLGITLAIPWRTWRLITRGEGQLRPNGFSTSSPIVMLKGGKLHFLISR